MTIFDEHPFSTLEHKNEENGKKFKAMTVNQIYSLYNDHTENKISNAYCKSIEFMIFLKRLDGNEN